MSDKDIRHEVPAIGQPNTQTCWVASYQMCYAWHKRCSPGKAKTDVEAKLKAAGFDIRHELKPALWYKASVTIGPWAMSTAAMRDYDQFLWCLERGPIWCAGIFSGGPHAIVVTGIARKYKELYVNDPWQIAKHGSAGTRMYYKAWSETIFNLEAACQAYYNGR